MSDLLRVQVAALRKRRRLTQKDLGDAIGVTPGMVSHFETGRHELSIEKIQTAAHALKARWALVPEEEEADTASSGDAEIEELVSLLRDHAGSINSSQRHAIRVMVEALARS